MKAIFLYVILLFCSFFYVIGAKDCEGSLYKVSHPSENNECYVLDEDYRNTQGNPHECSYLCANNPNVTYVVEDAKRGIVKARFPLPPPHCLHNLYKVSLKINELVQEESVCSVNLTMNFTHSTKEYRIKTCEKGSCIGKPCGKHGEVVFNYVFTGCYKLFIEASQDTHSRMPSHSCPKFIETNFTKLRLEDAEPELVFNYRQAENVCTLDVMYPQAISKATIELNFSENDSSVSGAEVSVKAGIEAAGKTSVCIPTSNIMEPTCNFSYVNLFNGIMCNFFNVSPGNYCVRIRIDDDRCVQGTWWTPKGKGCRWNHQIVLDYTPPDKPEISVLSSYTVVIVSALLGIALGVLIIVGLVLRRRARLLSQSPVESPEEVVRPMINGFKVLLLYPRDCQEFMKVMESFRKLLEANNIEVFDCYSCDEVLNGPLYWLQRVMAFPQLCTIVVNTQCAFLQQQAILSDCNVTSYAVYREPTFLDSIFMYGLKVITEDVSADNYLKRFVIGINDFSDDQKLISLPASFRRYNVPEHLPKLFSDMNLEFIQESGQLYNSSEYIELLSNVRNLVNYKSMNPQYLDNILNLV